MMLPNTECFAGSIVLAVYMVQELEGSSESF